MSKNLDELRKEIDEVDNLLLKLLVRRMEIVEGVIAYKEKEGLPVFDKRREKSIINIKRNQAEEVGLDSDFIEELYEVLMKESRKIQMGIRDDKNKK